MPGNVTETWQSLANGAAAVEGREVMRFTGLPLTELTHNHHAVMSDIQAQHLVHA